MACFSIVLSVLEDHSMCNILKIFFKFFNSQIDKDAWDEYQLRKALAAKGMVSDMSEKSCHFD